jgi:hypothetical protein
MSELIRDELIAGKLDPYDMLTDFAAFLQGELKAPNNKLSTNLIPDVVKTTKKFLRYSKVPITNDGFKEQVPYQESKL